MCGTGSQEEKAKVMARSEAHYISGKSFCISVVRIVDIIIIIIYLTVKSFIIYYNLNDDIDTHIMNVMKWKIHLHGAGILLLLLTAVRSLFSSGKSVFLFFKSVYFMLV